MHPQTVDVLTVIVHVPWQTTPPTMASDPPPPSARATSSHSTAALCCALVHAHGLNPPVEERDGFATSNNPLRLELLEPASDLIRFMC